jgi:hypothetical protein
MVEEAVVTYFKVRLEVLTAAGMKVAGFLLVVLWVVAVSQ